MATKTGAQLQANLRLKALMADYFGDLAQTDRDRTAPVAWCTSVGPAELLRAMGFRVFFPENHGAMLGATRMAAGAMPQAHALGYSQDICSYLTSDIGAFLADQTPLAKAYGIERVPRPAVLVYNTNQCREVKDWFSWYGRELGVPVLGIHSPTELGELHDEAISDVAIQMKRLHADLAPLAPHGADLGLLDMHIDESYQACLLWRRCLESAAARPAPWTFFDQTVHMAPIVVLRGTPEATAYYHDLAFELEEEVVGGACAVERERHRVYWEGMPIWGRLRALSELFGGLGTALVASTYCNSWILDFGTAGDPWERMARAYLGIFIARSEQFKEDYIARISREFGATGVIFHDSKTCPHNSNSRFGMPRRLEAREGLPVLVLEGDLNDPRCFSLEEARVRIEVFLEQLEEASG